MAGLWGGVPASPCSALSGDALMRPRTNGIVIAQRLSKPQHASSPVSDSHLSSKRPLSPLQKDETSAPTVKRTRSDVIDVDAVSVVDSPTCASAVEFAEAKASVAESSDFVAHLNVSAADERRKELLQRLRAIDARKAQLAGAQVSTPLQDTVIVGDISTAPDLQRRSRSPGKSTSGPKRANGRKSRASRGKSARRTKTPPRSKASSVIDVDAELSVPNETVTRKSRARPASASAGRKKPSVPVRSSSRVRRPRGQQSEASTETKAERTPTCMSKCRQFQYCKKLVGRMLRDPVARPFSAPVDELWPEHAIPRYFDVISRPMDLRTVKKNMDTSVYVVLSEGGALPYRFNVSEFVKDVHLIFRNSMIYNKPADMLYITAKSLAADFEQALQDLPSPPCAKEVGKAVVSRPKTNRRARKVSHNLPRLVGKSDESPAVVDGSDDDAGVVVAPATAVGTAVAAGTESANASHYSEASSVEELREKLQYLDSCRVPVIARQPIPKGAGYLSRAALLYEHEMPYEQKVRIMGVIQDGKVPTGKIEVLVGMLRQATGEFEQSSADEVELNFEELSNTGWRNAEAFLEQFVPGFKTVRSSVLGREFNSVDELDEEASDLKRRLALLTDMAEERSSRIAPKPRSFFDGGGGGEEDESSSDSSDGDSEDSDSSDSESEAE